MNDLAINLLASLIAGITVWLVQRLLRYRRAARRRAFFGLVPGERALLVVGKHRAAPAPMSINKTDVAAVLELAMLAKDAGAEPEIALHSEVVEGVGDQVEFCVGGPLSNSRTAAHLRWLLPGVSQSTYREDPEGLSVRVGDRVFSRERGGSEYVLVARIVVPGRRRPLFLVCGQTAITNYAAAKYLVEQQDSLHAQYGARTSFCLVLRIVNRDAYGSDVVELAADVTEAAAQRTITKPEAGAAIEGDPTGK
ncbi:hypothetical protein [Lentzea kentuckyensis]|uniref:hypothetical protein n=1 Tax=Lentzea kentuckyensis TaxID=360086 RepID=UPI000A387E5C|nr:hypothetical protein [Lentzea kentuckyensis]